MSNRWPTFSREQKIIIRMVKEFPCLYDKDLQSSRDSNAKNVAWKKIAEKANVDVIDAKLIWSKLRNRLASAINRRKRNKRNPHKPIGSSYGELNFIIPHMEVVKYAKDLELFPADEADGSATAKPERISDTDSDVEAIIEAECEEEVEAAAAAIAVGTPPPRAAPHDDVPDGVELFCLSVAAAAKRLPTAERVRLRIRVCEVVSGAQLRHLDGEQR